MASEKMAQRPQSSYDDYVNTLQKIAPQLRSLLSQLNSEQVIRGGATSGEGECVGGAGALEASSSTRRSSTSSSSRKRTTGSRSTGSRSTTSRSSGSRSSGTRSSGSSSTRTRRSGAPPRRNADGMYGDMDIYNGDESTIQAVSNCGKIVYGVVRDGKLDVQGTVGEVCEDLLGVDSVNGGRKRNSTSRSRTGTSGRSGTSRSTTGRSGTGRSGTSSSTSSSRRRTSANNPCSMTSSSSSTSTGVRRRASNLMNAAELDGGMC
ncbi:virion core protein [Pseudocowpox virus]|uniref:25 kDa core protein OPG138 n=1 Tax=Pseudocowpox virus TaxID=129726 RepID=D3IZN6_9POXV|nr:virion core protein [Pseudocowpox virus]ADC53990.1 virion core protein [Pseudocowpox virus]